MDASKHNDLCLLYLVVLLVVLLHMGSWQAGGSTGLCMQTCKQSQHPKVISG